MYNILEHKQAIAENIQKAFGDTPEDIEKAKWQIGEIRVDSRGIAHECYEYTAEGKPRLRRVKKNKGASTDNGGSKKNVVDISKIPDKEFKNITKILEKKNPDDSDAFRYLESEEMSGKELSNFIACAKHFKNDVQHINERTRKWCAKWEKLGEEELNNRKDTKDKDEKKQVDKPEQKTEDLFKVGELKNGFKFKKNTEYVLRYNKYEKQYEVFENKTQRGAGKVPMWVCKSDNGDEKFGEKILKVVQKNYAKEGSTISFGNKIYPLSLNDKK